MLAVLDTMTRTEAYTVCMYENLVHPKFIHPVQSDVFDLTSQSADREPQ